MTWLLSTILRANSRSRSQRYDFLFSVLRAGLNVFFSVSFWNIEFFTPHYRCTQNEYSNNRIWDIAEIFDLKFLVGVKFCKVDEKYTWEFALIIIPKVFLRAFLCKFFVDASSPRRLSWRVVFFFCKHQRTCTFASFNDFL